MSTQENKNINQISTNQNTSNILLNSNNTIYTQQQQKQQSQIQNIDNFIINIKQFTFPEKYFKWVSLLKQLQKQQSNYYLSALQKFVQYYPFNYTYWGQLCQLYIKQGKGKAAALKMYQIAVNKNPRCISLWEKYLIWLKKSISKNDPGYLKNQFQKATKIIGNHYKAGFIFVQYISLENDIKKKYNMYKKTMVSPLQDIDRIFQDFCKFIDQLDQQNLKVIAYEIEQLSKISNKTNKGQSQQHKTNSNNNNSSFDEKIPLQLRQDLKNNAKKLYQPTKQHVAIRYQYQSKISIDQYKPYQDSIQNWRNYIQFIKNSGNLQFLPALYQRALITQCDNQSLWEQYFIFLENQQEDHHRALYLLRSHSTFFTNLSKSKQRLSQTSSSLSILYSPSLIYYWIQLQQRQDPSHARQLYIQIQKQQYHIESYLKHIQLQIRSKQFQNAKKIYQTIMTVFSSNMDILSYIIIQYAQFQIKYLRDVKFARKLLKQYFDSHLFNQYLYFNYLDFFSKYVQYKQGSKQGKQAYQQYVHIVVNGLKGALQYFSNQYYRIKKVAKNKLRNYVTSIYLLKNAEKRIKELQINAKKDQRVMKRTLQQFQNQNYIENNNINKKINPN